MKQNSSCRQHDQIYGYLSKGIGNVDHLSTFLNGECIDLNINSASDVSFVLGWGVKPSADKAKAYAEKLQLRYVSLEDGFIRSLGLGVDGAVQHSLIVDYTSIYYNARQTSDLEVLISASDGLTEKCLQRAHQAIAFMRETCLSKYNHAPYKILPKSSKSYRVLVVDQTAGDASIEYGLASAESFERMLKDAVKTHPNAEILVKIHPDVLAGKKQGHLLDLSRQLDCTLLTESLNPWSVLEQVTDVYVVTSQMGFEALIAGCKVHCYGAPFYAGWGLTHDDIDIPRRKVSRTLEQIFHAAYIQYCHYVNPYTGRSCDIEDTMVLIATQKEQSERFKGVFYAIGFSKWKQPYVHYFLGKETRVEFLNDDSSLPNKGNLLVWSSKVTTDILDHCKEHGVQLWRMEDGFIRSVGLGVDLVPPLSLVLDSKGIYYDATQSNDLEDLLENTEFSGHLLERAQKLIHALVSAGLSKYNVGKSSTKLNLPANKTIILVPGQVETDASIRMGSPRLTSNLALLQQVRLECPDAFVIYKPHPDVLAGGRAGKSTLAQAQPYYDVLITDVAMPQLLDQVDEVHTMTSLTGFEALLRDIKVVTYGLPFYAGWGLTHDKEHCVRRTRKLTLEQLVAATLILYPVYVDPNTGDIITPETAVELLRRQLGNVQGPSVKTRIMRLLLRFMGRLQ